MSLLGEDDARFLAAALVSRAGGYLRNPIRQPYVTCAVCTTPVDQYWLCYQCSRAEPDGVADATAFLTYAVSGYQSGYVMRGYKAQQPVGEHVNIVAMLVWLALSMHQHCPARLGGHASDPLAPKPGSSPPPTSSVRVTSTRRISLRTVNSLAARMCS
jgi:hypothetical protein